MTEHHRVETGQPDGAPSGNVPGMTPTKGRFRIGWPLIIALTLIAGVWAGGAVWSFAEQTAYAEFKHFEIPELLPLVIDGLAVAMAAVAWAASLDGRPAVWARLGAALAVAGSAASNAAWADERSAHDIGTIALAVAVPVAANVAFEVLLAEIRKQVQRWRGVPGPVQLPMPRVHQMWLSPWSTFWTWRRLVLQATDLRPQFEAAMAASRTAVHGSGTPQAGGVSGPPASTGTPPRNPRNGLATPFVVTVPAPLAAPLWNPSRNGVGTPGGTGAGTPRRAVSEPLGTPVGDTPANGAGTPGRNPTDTPAEPRRGTGAAKGSGTPLTSGGTPAAKGSDTGAGTLGWDGAETPDEFPADAVLLPVLLDPERVRREPDGTVPVKRAMRVLEIGRPRAIRMLSAHGLLRETGAGTPDAKGADTPAAEGSDDDLERHPEPLNGSDRHPDPTLLIGAIR